MVMAGVTLVDVQKNFGPVKVVRDVNLSLSDGEFIALLGPSGCGKSTTLRMIAGLEEATAGRIFIGERDVTQLQPRDRNIGMVFQNYALYPHKTVRDNMGFGLRMRGASQYEIETKVAAAAAMLSLDELLDRKPKQLSGGQMQRVALGRALVRDADVFLLDEPLSNLDAKLRAQMRVELSQLHRRVGKTMVYVTHDQVEAMTMADKIVIMNNGVVEQVGSPLEIFDRPATRFVASFVGSPEMNFLQGVMTPDGVSVLGTEVQCKGAIPLEAGRAVTLGIRPEHLTLSKSGPLEFVVDVAEQHGISTLLVGTISGVRAQIVTARCGAAFGDRLSVGFDVAHIHFFDPDTAKRIMMN
jgi:sn-glycerol 3-phosphate transport system ATP-binding protein/multiple sugar transport system ATP-binding protein